MKLRLMTNNQWKNNVNTPAWEAMGADCSAAIRATGFARVFDDIRPDVVGLQEVSPLMLSELVENLLERKMNYSVIWGADTPIAYNADKLELLDTAFSFHSEHIPLFEGSFNNEKTKSYTVAVFRCKEAGSCFAFATTHLWWMSNSDRPHSDEAREYQLGVVIDTVERLAEKYNCPCVIVGDLNADYRSGVLELSRKRGYVHAHDIATEYADATNGTHYCFQSGYKGYVPEEFERGIDHILLKGIKDGALTRFDRYYPEYYMALSDHFPAYADVEF